MLENATTHSIRIDFYENKVLAKDEMLSPGTLWQTHYEQDLASGVDAYVALKADSVAIYYNEAKVQHHTLFSSTAGNILYNNSYQIVNENMYRYTFTEEDYLKADSIQ